MVEEQTQTFKEIKWALTTLKTETWQLIPTTTTKWMQISTIKLWQRERNNEH